MRVVRMSVIITEQELTSELVIEGFRYWQSKRKGATIPARSEFDPLLEIPGLVRFMMLKDVQWEPLDFRYRLVGTGLLNHLTTDWTGKFMSEVEYQRPPSTIWDYHRQVAESGEPLFIKPNYVGPHKDYLFIESVMLPLASDHRRVDMIMIFIDFLPQDSGREND
jgi:hypothetical protein